MVIKERKIPLVLLILEALSRRLPLNHHKYQQILEELGRRQAGYKGEVSLDYFLRLLPMDKYTILHDLNLPDGDYNCQIDTLLLTSEYALIIEVKNIAGKLIFDTENEQFIQVNNEKEKGYPYPIAQAERHREHLMKLMAEYKFPTVPILYLVVISNGNSSYVITGRNSHKVKPRVCKADVLLNRISSLENQYTRPILNAKEIKKLSRLLIKLNTIPTNYILKKYQIKSTDVLTGVFCPTCNHAPLIRKKKKWYCTACNIYSKDAHVSALRDYFLLIDLNITNQQFRVFVHLDSIDTAGRMLRSEKSLKATGTKKMRTYSPVKFP